MRGSEVPPIPASKNPLDVRVWALLHYLDYAPSPCHLFELQTYLRGNWPATRELVEISISRGWVVADADHRKFSITDPGRRYLTDLRRVLEPLYAEAMGPFRRRLGEPVDYPK